MYTSNISRLIHWNYHSIKIMRISKASSPPEWKLFNLFFFKIMFPIQYFINCNLFHMFFLPNKINKIWNKKINHTIHMTYCSLLCENDFRSSNFVFLLEKKILINKLPNNYCIIVISEKHDADNRNQFCIGDPFILYYSD